MHFIQANKYFRHIYIYGEREYGKVLYGLAILGF